MEPTEIFTPVRFLRRADGFLTFQSYPRRRRGGGSRSAAAVLLVLSLAASAGAAAVWLGA